MPDAFHQSPILNSPYEVPARHWVLDEGRRKISFISPTPTARKAGGKQARLALDAESEALDTGQQQYQLIVLIDSLHHSRYLTEQAMLVAKCLPVGPFLDCASEERSA